MKKWDILLFPHPSAEEPHPCVVISHDGICANETIAFVNVLVCRTVRPPSRLPKPNEVYLNEADGLNWKTLVKCDFVYVFPKSDGRELRGRVCVAHQTEIRKKLQEFL